MYKGYLNKNDMIFHLGEAKEAIEVLIRDIQSGKLDSSGSIPLGIDFQHILGHLCSAWHTKWLKENYKLSDEDYEQMVCSVPKWDSCLKLVDIDEPKAYDMRDEL